MGDRLDSLKRIAKVQAEMVKLAEWRIAAADSQLAALRQDRIQLADYVSTSGGHGVPIAKSALRAMLAIDARQATIEDARVAETARLDTLRRRDRAVTGRLEAASAERRRTIEATELAAALDAWLARPDDEATGL